MGHVVPLIQEAWEHRRWRRRMLGRAALIAAVAAAATLVLVARHSGVTNPAHPVARAHGHDTLVTSSRVLSRAPYLGVRCPMPNSIACDRVGLAVWLRRPAWSVTASIAGAEMTLRDPDRPGATTVASRTLYGYLHRAGLLTRLGVRTGNATTWFGAHRPSPVVRLTISYRGGQTVDTRLRVPLSPGWG